MPQAQTFEVATLVIGVAGGLALFLYGMERLTEALKKSAGSRLQRLLARLTTNRFKGAFVGAFVTAIIQSSSVTTVLVVGFISAGLLSLSQSVAVIIGANIGTTITAQIIAFKVTKYALAIVAVGFAGSFFGRSERVRLYGSMLFGLGLIFFGMELMSEATRPLRSLAPFISAMQSMDNPALAILVSAGFTAVVQSSSATTGLIIVLAGQGFISLEAGILLMFGANIGTCVTALLAAIGKERNAVRAAAVHVVFNVAGVLLWIAFVDYLALGVRSFSPQSAHLAGTARLAAEVPRQIANAHTLFNVANALFFIGLTGPMAWLVTRLIPDSKKGRDGVAAPKYLDDLLLDTPDLALDRIRMELRRLGERAHDMVDRSLEAVLTGDENTLAALRARDDEIDSLHDAVIEYTRKLSQRNIGSANARRLTHYSGAANNIESIGDMVETNLVGAGRERLKHGLDASEVTRSLLEQLHAKVTWSVQMALESLDASSVPMARSVIEAKESLSAIAEELEEHLTVRLAVDEDNRLKLFKFESEITEYLRRVYYFAKRIAKLVVSLEENAQKDSS